jgi:ankyrin repeat protein
LLLACLHGSSGLVRTGKRGPSCTRALHPVLVCRCMQASALVELGADPNISADVFHHRGVSPLCVAVARNDTGLARSLLDAGAVKFWADPRGRTALMYAARCGSVSVCTCLRPPAGQCASLCRGACVNRSWTA